MLEFKYFDKLKKEVEALSKTTKLISFIRFLLACNFILWIICLLSLQEYLLYGFITVLSFVTFLVFVFLTNHYFRALALVKRKETVYQSHFYRRNLELNAFPDDGKEYLKGDDYKLADLDIFGAKSLFQFLCVAKTKLGRDLLAKQLSNPEKKNKAYPLAILAFGENENTLNIEASILEFKSQSKNTSYEEYTSIIGKKIIVKPWKIILSILSYVFLITYLILAFVMNLYKPLIVLFFVLNLIAIKILMKNEIYSMDSFKYYKLSSAYYDLSTEICKTAINNSFLNLKQKTIEKEMSNLKKLRNAYFSLSSRKNVIVDCLLNGLFGYDIWLAFYYNSYTQKMKNLSNLFNEIAEIETMISFANIAIDTKTYCIPESGSNLKAKNIVHPLIKECVPNSIELAGGVVLTGSNMSGKTTFMRTIGVNQILFNAGSLVCAESFFSKDYPIYTSLRANDMLSEGISTFYAEIMRMKKINQAIKETHCLILVDEIFKGTNATDRIDASLKVIAKLNNYQSLFIITTHDYELCDALGITNYHFTEKYIEDKITFDYQLKDGKCNSTNAIYLLKMADII